MSANNGVIRIGRKGIKKFAFGDEGTPGSEPFEIDVVTTFQEWLIVDENFRPIEEDKEGNRPIPTTEMPAYYAAAVDFVEGLRVGNKQATGYQKVTTSEALDFLARLREQYNELVVFFRPKLQEERASPDTSEAELRFSVEGQKPS